MTIFRNYKVLLSLAVLLAVIGVVGMLWQKPWQAGASVTVGSQYQSTTTPTVNDLTNLCPQRLFQASSTTGLLGTVNILKSGAGGIAIYDATTTNINLRGGIATSSLLLAEFPGSATVGSFVFDTEFKNGLLIDYGTTGTGVSSSTISYRCEG